MLFTLTRLHFCSCFFNLNSHVLSVVHRSGSKLFHVNVLQKWHKLDDGPHFFKNKVPHLITILHSDVLLQKVSSVIVLCVDKIL